MELIVLFGSFIVLLLLNVPIAFSLGISSILTLVVSKEMSLDIIARGMFSTIDVYALLAVPLFILAGSLMEYGGLSRRLVDVMKAFAGHLTGGMAAVTIAACTFFASLSGSGPATVAAIGGIMIPAMVKEKYDIRFSTGLAASAGTLGIIIPPSIPLIIYGVVTGTSIGALFIAGVIPGLLIATALWGISYFVSKKRNYKSTEAKLSWKKRLKVINEAKLTLLMPVIILGGIYGGIFTPTEAAGIAVLYSAVIGFFVYREIKLKNLFEICKQTVLISGIIIIIIAIASTFGRILIIEQVPVIIVNFLTSLSDSKWIILSLIILFLVLIGTFMETAALIILLAPILLPVVSHFGIDPIHFGIIMIVASEIGYITPPVGDNLNAASAISGLSFEEVSKAALPFALLLLVMLFIIAFIPSLSMFLPSMLSK